MQVIRTRVLRSKQDILSFAVFAFAVEETNERDSVITSATPFALLQDEDESIVPVYSATMVTHF